MPAPRLAGPAEDGAQRLRIVVLQGGGAKGELQAKRQRIARTRQK